MSLRVKWFSRVYGTYRGGFAVVHRPRFKSQVRRAKEPGARGTSLTLCAAYGGNSNPYYTIASVNVSELVAKNSRFLAKAVPISSVDQAMDFIRSESDPSASHNCFAYQLGKEYRSTDDGEPSGTAGRPILSAIQQEDLDHVCVLVTRYYGGTKLGTGGLCRAYGGAARECLQACARVEVKPKISHRLIITFDDIGPVYSLLDSLRMKRQSEEYVEDGVEITIELEAQQAANVNDSLKQITRGRVSLGDM